MYLVHLVEDTELNIGEITSFLAYLLEHSQVNTVKNINKRAGLKMTKTIGCPTVGDAYVLLINDSSDPHKIFNEGPLPQGLKIFNSNSKTILHVYYMFYYCSYSSSRIVVAVCAPPAGGAGDGVAHEQLRSLPEHKFYFCSYYW